MKYLSVVFLLWLSLFVYGQHKANTSFIIANAETNLLYRHYENQVNYTSGLKMDSIWIECDSAKITKKEKYLAVVEITSKSIRFIEITLKGSKGKKMYEVGKQKFLVANIPAPTLFLGKTPINSDLNERPNSIFEEKRCFLIIPPTTMITASNQIHELNLSVGEKSYTFHGGHIPEYIQKAILDAPKGTKIYFNYYVYSGTGGHAYEKVNLSLFYIKKEDPQ